MNIRQGVVYINRKKIRTFISILPVFVILWITFGFNTDNPDYNNYVTLYGGGYRKGTEKGFALLADFIKMLGFNYQGFLIIISFIILLIITVVVLKNSKKPIYVLITFAFYPFLINCIQMRQFLSFVIVLTGIVALVKNEKGGVIKFIVAVVIASLIHYQSIFYLALLFYKIPIRKYTKIVMMFLLCMFVAILTYSPMFYNLAVLITGGWTHITAWFMNHARFGMVIPIGFQLMSFCIFIYAYNRTKRSNYETIFDSDILFGLNVSLLFVLPLYFINGEFMRIYRNFMIINTIYYSNIFFEGEQIGEKYKLLKISNWIQILIGFGYQVLGAKDMWISFFKDNIVFNMLIWEHIRS